MLVSHLKDTADAKRIDLRDSRLKIRESSKSLWLLWLRICRIVHTHHATDLRGITDIHPDLCFWIRVRPIQIRRKLLKLIWKARGKVHELATPHLALREGGEIKARYDAEVAATSSFQGFKQIGVLAEIGVDYFAA